MSGASRRASSMPRAPVPAWTRSASGQRNVKVSETISTMSGSSSMISTRMALTYLGIIFGGEAQIP